VYQLSYCRRPNDQCCECLYAIQRSNWLHSEAFRYVVRQVLVSAIWSTIMLFCSCYISREVLTIWWNRPINCTRFILVEGFIVISLSRGHSLTGTIPIRFVVISTCTIIRLLWYELLRVLYCRTAVRVSYEDVFTSWRIVINLYTTYEVKSNQFHVHIFRHIGRG